MVQNGVKLTKREEELMDFMWEHGEPVTCNDILELSTSHSWKENYLQIMLRSLLGKGLIKEVGTVRYVKQYARQFMPTVSKEEYFVNLAAGKNLNKRMFFKAAVTMLARESDNDRKELIQQLEQMLQEFSYESEDDSSLKNSK